MDSEQKLDRILGEDSALSSDYREAEDRLLDLIDTDANNDDRLVAFIVGWYLGAGYSIDQIDNIFAEVGL